MKMVLQNIVSFIVLVLVQVLVLNNIHFMGYINPYIYILFILLLQNSKVSKSVISRRIMAMS
jgi:uncharacterized protein YxeA